MWGRIERDEANDDQRDIEAIKYAISRGMKSIDTAEMYAAGQSEIILGKAIEGIQREELFISSKVSGDNCNYQGIKNACRESLKRMNIEYINLYYIHWKTEKFDVKECMKAMNELREEGLIKYIGVSNFSVESLQEAQSVSKYPIVANQVHYNLIYREPELSGLLKYCQESDVILVAWRPFEYGDFAIRGSEELLSQMREKYKKTDFQIALNWLISQKNVVTIFKSSTLSHIDNNLESLGWEMSSEDIELLRSEFPGQQSISNAVPLA